MQTSISDTTCMLSVLYYMRHPGGVQHKLIVFGVTIFHILAALSETRIHICRSCMVQQQGSGSFDFDFATICFIFVWVLSSKALTSRIRLAVSFVVSTIKSQLIIYGAVQSAVCVYTILTLIDSDFFSCLWSTKNLSLLIELQLVMWYCNIDLHIFPLSVGLRLNLYRLLIEHDNYQYL